MSRVKLPDERPSVTRRIQTDKFDGYLTVGFYDNDQPGEIFITVAKEGSFVKGAFNMIALEASLLLQHGCPAATLAAKWRHLQHENGDLFGKLADALLGAVNLRGGKVDEGHGYSEPKAIGSFAGEMISKKHSSEPLLKVLKERDLLRQIADQVNSLLGLCDPVSGMIHPNDGEKAIGSLAHVGAGIVELLGRLEGE